MVPVKSNQISRLQDNNSKFTNATFYEPTLQLSEAKKSLSSGLVNHIDENRLKQVSRRIDYNFFNYCSICELKYPKEVLRCKDCNQKVRTRPWHRSKIIDRKRI